MSIFRLGKRQKQELKPYTSSELVALHTGAVLRCSGPRPSLMLRAPAEHTATDRHSLVQLYLGCTQHLVRLPSTKHSLPCSLPWIVAGGVRGYNFVPRFVLNLQPLQQPFTLAPGETLPIRELSTSETGAATPTAALWFQ